MRSAFVLVLLASFGALGAAACSTSMPEPPPLVPAAADAPPTFTFAPPAHERFVRTERRSVEMAIVGTNARSADEEVLRWNVDAHRLNTSSIVDQELAHVTLRHNGRTIVDGAPPLHAVTAQLVLDVSGNLQDVRGLDGAPDAIASMASPDDAPLVKAIFSTQNLRATIAMRHDEIYGALTGGRPATAGASWTALAKPQHGIESREVTVERIEPCGSGRRESCARVAIDLTLDPRIAENAAVSMVQSWVRSQGGDTRALHAKSGASSEQGSIWIEPATMVVHGASFVETGRALVTGAKGRNGAPREVEIRGTTEYTYDYASEAVSAL